MTHDYNQPLADYIRFEVTPRLNLIRSSGCFDCSVSLIEIFGIPPHMFEVTNVAELLFSSSLSLSKRFARQQLPSCCSIAQYHLSMPSGVFDYCPDSVNSPAFYNLKRAIRTTFDLYVINVTLEVPTARIQVVVDCLSNIINKKYNECRDLQNKYDNSFVLF